MDFWTVSPYIAAPLCVLIAYALFMWGYFLLRRAMLHRRYLADVLVIALALLLSTAVRFFVAWKANEATSPAEVLHALYAAIGGFTFESADAFETISPFLASAYYGVVLLVGLVALSVITAHVSYELYSSIVYWFYKLGARLGFLRDVYVFTAVSEDALLLARDISRAYREGRGGKKKCLILFAGNELEAYDRRNELHRAIMGQGYLYLSFLKCKNKQREKSLVRRLKLKKNCNAEATVFSRRVCVFALRQNDALTGAEAKNSDSVFDDISASLRDGAKLWSDAHVAQRPKAADDSAADVPEKGKKRKKRKKPEKGKKEKMVRTVVHYYILTDEEINYEFYKRELAVRVRDGVEEVLGKLSGGEREKRLGGLSEKELADRLSEDFVLHIFNEALLAAHDLAILRRRAFRAADADRQVGWADSTFCADSRADGGAEYRVFVLGFGKTAQLAMNTLFVQTAYVDENGIPSRFVADVYDRAVEERSGVFSYMHPLYHCRNCESIEPVGPDELTDNLTPGTAHRAMEKGTETPFAKLDRKMGFPFVCFHRTSCFDDAFMGMLDKNIIGKRQVRAFLVCLGDDEANIRLANAIIDDYKHELYAGEEARGQGRVRPQVLYVHIRDEKNYSRLNWSAEEAEYLRRRHGGSLFVIPFGKRDALYSHARLIDEYECAFYHYSYSANSAALKKSDSPLVAVRDLERSALLAETVQSEKGASGKMRRASKQMNEDKRALAANALERGKVEREWLKCEAFLRESNYSALLFSVNFSIAFRRLYADKTPDEADAFVRRRMIGLEKTRWCRFYMASGWTYGNYDASDTHEKEMRRLAKEHQGLCSYEFSKRENAFSFAVSDLVSILCGILTGDKDMP